MIPYEKAKELLMNSRVIENHRNAVESLHLWEAGGRILAEDIIAGEDVPPFDRSPVDGYAVIASDTVAAAEEDPVILEVTGSIAAGTTSEYRLSPGTAIKIFTGAPLPEYANCIVKTEDVFESFFVDEKEFIKLTHPVASGEVIAFKGEDIQCGETMLLKGSIINPACIGILATLGVSTVPVFKKPLIGIFSTGDELVNVENQLKHGQLRASNIYTLSEIIRLSGCEPVNLGVIKDSIDDILSVYCTALKLDLPVIISTGGTASGDKDLIKEAMIKLGSSRLFNKVAIRPGAPVVASEMEERLLIGLSGNPSGSTVGALTLLMPFISKMAGRIKELDRVRAILKGSIFRHGGLRAFLWGNCCYDKDIYQVEANNNQFCGAVRSFASSNCLIDVPAGKVNLSTGDSVEILRFSV